MSENVAAKSKDYDGRIRSNGCFCTVIWRAAESEDKELWNIL